ncbi:hypothetical protein [Tsukamurella hominis]|uniref:hypothetical protein n=1 Tax=Tsukamurella hominis TaxID=1970232 RepID=UPI0039E811F5
MSTKTGNTTDFTTLPATSALAGTDVWPSGYDEIHYDADDDAWPSGYDEIYYTTEGARAAAAEDGDD